MTISKSSMAINLLDAITLTSMLVPTRCIHTSSAREAARISVAHMSARMTSSFPPKRCTTAAASLEFSKYDLRMLMDASTCPRTSASSTKRRTSSQLIVTATVLPMNVASSRSKYSDASMTPSVLSSMVTHGKWEESTSTTSARPDELAAGIGDAALVVATASSATFDETSAPALSTFAQTKSPPIAFCAAGVDTSDVSTAAAFPPTNLLSSS